MNVLSYDVLVACETSGETRSRLRAMGINAMSCDILPADDGSDHHFTGDVNALLDMPWGMIIAHPPCTYLANSGVRWLHTKPGRWEKMRQGAEFFSRMLNANSPLIAVENPVMHKYAREIVGRRADFTMQPWQHGDAATKRTCWWLKGLPVVEPTRVCTPEEVAEAKLSKQWDAIHKAPPGSERWKVRSKTYPGIASAIAQKWGKHYLQQAALAA